MTPLQENVEGRDELRVYAIQAREINGLNAMPELGTC
jgi:hypothetical protein